MEKLIVALLVFGVISITRCCPPAEDIAPYCTCTTRFVDNMMFCKGFYNPDELVGPMRAIALRRAKVFSLAIESSSLQYIPHEVFKDTGIEKIRFLSTELMSLSETDVAFSGLEDTLMEIRATDAHYVTQWDWQSIRNLKKMQLIDVNWITLGSLEDPFPELPELTALGIIKAEISFIVDSAFAKLPKLTILNMKSNDISEFKRNMLPNPAERLSILDLSENILSSLPEDFFTNMPSLSVVHLDKNRFVTLSENTFQTALVTLLELTMTDNPFRCDCRIRWLAGKRVPFTFLATCKSPENLAGRNFRTLDMKSLWC